MSSPDVPPHGHPDDRKATIALVTGRPGSGKTTLARMLGEAVSCPVVSRDEIYEGIALNVGREDRGLVGWLAFDAFFRALTLLVSCRVTVIADAAFQDRRWRIGLGPILPLADVRIIRCTANLAIAHRRAAEHRRVSHDVPSGEAGPQDVAPFEPLSLRVPSLAVSTANGYAPELDRIAEFVLSD